MSSGTKSPATFYFRHNFNNKTYIMDNSNIFNFRFNGVNIPFKANLGDIKIFIDATEMAKSACSKKSDYDKLRPSRWIRSVDYKNYVDALFRTGRILDICEVIMKVPVIGKEGSFHIWMEKNLSIRYAQWLSSEFAIWVDDRIDEILTQGYSFMTQENGNLQTIISQLQAKENYVNDIINCASVNTYSTRDICMGLGLRISSYQFNNMLVDHDVAFRKGTGLYLKSPHCYMGLQKIVYETCPDGKKRANVRWTEAGKMWVYSRLKDWGVI